MELTPGNIYNGDCLELLPQVGAASVDLVILDPPYHRVVNEGWDKEHKRIADFVTFIRAAVLECKRVLKPNGSLFIFGDDKNIAYLQVELDKHLTLLNSIVWFKTNNQSIKAAPNLRSYAPMTERILFYENGAGDNLAMKAAGYDSQCQALLQGIFKIGDLCRDGGITRRQIANLIVKDYKNMESAQAQASNWILGKNIPNPVDFQRLKTIIPILGEYEDLRREYEDLRREYEDLRREYEDLRRVFNASSDTLDVITGPIVSQRDNTDHPTTKPLWLIRKLINDTTKPGAVVLDPMAGSGTTAIAAIETGRNWLCIEKDAGYFQIAQERIRERLAQPFLPGIAEGQPVKVEQVKLFCD